MEHSILQNGVLNIYEHYFDDIIPTELVKPRDLRWRLNSAVYSMYIISSRINCGYNLNAFICGLKVSARKKLMSKESWTKMFTLKDYIFYDRNIFIKKIAIVKWWTSKIQSCSVKRKSFHYRTTTIERLELRDSRWTILKCIYSCRGGGEDKNDYVGSTIKRFKI